MKRVRLSIAVSAVALLALPATASARASYCSPSGDTCIAVRGSGGSTVLRIGTSPAAGPRYVLCVTPPRGSRSCETFNLRRSGAISGSSVRWRLHFPNRGSGVYRARWRIPGGSSFPSLTFRVR